MSRDQINVRMEKELKMILIQKDNYSGWIRDACYEKLQRENNPDLIDNEIKQHQQIIQDLKDRKKKIPDNGQKIQECFDYWYNIYRDQRKIVEDHYNVKWISDKMLPVLQKLGCTQYSAKQILDIFVKHDKEGKLLINV